MLKPDRFSCSQKIWLKQDLPVLLNKVFIPKFFNIAGPKCDIKEVMNQVALQAIMVVIMALIDTEVGP